MMKTLYQPLIPHCRGLQATISQWKVLTLKDYSPGKERAEMSFQAGEVQPFKNKGDRLN